MHKKSGFRMRSRIKSKITRVLVVVAVAAGVMSGGCKPTEKNYRAAYDAALAKRDKVAEEQMRPANGLLSDDGPQQRVYEGDTIYVLREIIRMPDGGRLPSKWVVAVGMFKMDTNAKAGAEALKEEGWPAAFHAKAMGGKYYTIADTASTLGGAAEAAKRFQSKMKKYPYVGFPGAPVLIAP